MTFEERAPPSYPPHTSFSDFPSCLTRFTKSTYALLKTTPSETRMHSSKKKKNKRKGEKCRARRPGSNSIPSFLRVNLSCKCVCVCVDRRLAPCRGRAGAKRAGVSAAREPSPAPSGTSASPTRIAGGRGRGPQPAGTSVPRSTAPTGCLRQLTVLRSGHGDARYL